jgi:hypothetical protein
LSADFQLGRSGCTVLNQLTINSKLVSLDLRGNRLKSLPIDITRERFPVLQDLSLRLNSLGYDDGPQGLLVKLAALDLCRLSLRANRLQDTFAPELVKWLPSQSRLTALDVSVNMFTQQGLQAICNALKNNKRLLLLDICDTCVPADEADCLIPLIQSNRTLTSIRNTSRESGRTFQCSHCVNLVR